DDCVYFGPEPALDRSLIFNLGKNVRNTTSELQTKIDEFKPDIVHGFFLVNNGMYASRIEGYPKVMTALGSDVLISPNESKLLSWIVKRTIKKSDSVFGPPLLINEIKEWNLSTELNSNVIGINCSLFKPLEKTKTIVFARGFKEVYNPHVVSKAIKLLDSKLDGFQFVLCGDGPLKSESEEILKTCKNVEFTGHINEGKLAELVGKAQLVISPSLSDSIPLTILEAVACGSPVVASNIPANQNWVDEKLPVYIFDKEDPNNLAEKILEIVNDQTILNEALEIGPSLIKEKYSFENEGEKVEKKYFDLVNAIV
ncbi:MAG: glycosyltransferase, partial [Candidatus Poseidoniia archaeon]|nr:glycosyltransferase [Candidatus Poseidoniia archaeon]